MWRIVERYERPSTVDPLSGAIGKCSEISTDISLVAYIPLIIDPLLVVTIPIKILSSVSIETVSLDKALHGRAYSLVNVCIPSAKGISVGPNKTALV